MSLKFNTFTLLVTMLVTLTSTYAQDKKREVEKGIEKGEMPDPALDLLKPFMEDADRIHYYYEIDGETEGYESKFRWRKSTMLSIEFNTKGELMDIEQLIDINDIEKKTQKKIRGYFDTNYDKVKILRLQRQYVGEDSDDDDEEVIEEFIEGDIDDLTIRYEIVAQTRQKKKLETYEFLFDDEGQLVEKREVVRRSADNLLY